MHFDELDRLLRDSVADAALDDREKSELRQLGTSIGGDRIRFLRNRAFALVRERWSLDDPRPLDLLRWLEQVIRTLDTHAEPPPVEAHAYFAPGEDCLRRLRELCRGSKRTIDACVYTVSDDRLCDALIEAHRRGVAVRMISDDHKAHDTGSDVWRLRDLGLAVRMDASAFHMHHKFAVFDGRRLATGSFNWTRSASDGNEENLVVTDDARLVRAFEAQFERLWVRFAGAR